MTKRRTTLALLALLAAAAACDGTARSGGPPKAPPNREVALRGDDPAFRPLGRVDRSVPGALRFAWPAAGFALRFTGTSIALVLDDAPLPDDTPENDFLAISVDGRALPPVALSSGRRAYEIARGLSPGAHELVAEKRTEPEAGAITLYGAALDPGARALPPSPPSQRRVEIVGDSISAGAGIDGADGRCALTAAVEDATRSYGALAARALGADYEIVAWKGKGVLRNDDPRDRDTLPAIFGRTLPGDPASRDPLAARADAVVLNLGTNDFAHSEPPLDELRDAYAAFVARLRALHPGALIVLAVGPLLYDEPGRTWRTDARAAIAAVAEARRAAGDDRVALLDLWTDPADGVGCQSHPNLATHRKMAAELERLLRARLGW